MPLEPQEAATRIQSIWRRHQTQKLGYLEKPSTKVELYDAFVTSNEPDIRIPNARKVSDARFAFVSCSGLRTLEIIHELIDWANYQPSADGYKNIPKLFVVDNSAQVLLLWQLLKQCFLKPRNLKQALIEIAIKEDKFQLCNASSIITISDKICYLLSSLIKTPKQFSFFKNMIAKATILSGDYCDTDAFDFIRSHTENIPVYVYASNIIEYVNRPSRDHSRKVACQKNLAKFLENLYSLNLVCSIHSRTSVHEFLAVGCGIRPDHIILSFNESKNALLHKLADNRYLSLFGEPFAPLLNEPKISREVGTQTVDDEKIQFNGLKKGFLLPSNGSKRKQDLKKKANAVSSQASGFKPGFLLETPKKKMPQKLAPTPNPQEAAAVDDVTFSGFKPGFLVHQKKAIAPPKKTTLCSNATKKTKRKKKQPAKCGDAMFAGLKPGFLL